MTFLTKEEVKKRLGFKYRSAVERLRKIDPSFPLPHKIKGRIFWDDADVDAWQEAKRGQLREVNRARLEALKHK